MSVAILESCYNLLFSFDATKETSSEFFISVGAGFNESNMIHCFLANRLAQYQWSFSWIIKSFSSLKKYNNIKKILSI